MLRFSEVIWDICWPRLNRLNSCCHAILTSSTAPTQYQIAQTTWSTSIKPIKQIQPFRTSLLHGHDPFSFPISNTRISSSFQTYRFSQPWRSISTQPWMDTSEWWSQCPPWRCSWAPPPSSCALTDPTRIRWIRWSCGWLAEDFPNTTGSTTVFVLFLGSLKWDLVLCFPEIQKLRLLNFGWQPIRLELARGIFSPVASRCRLPDKVQAGFQMFSAGTCPDLPWGVNETYL